MKKMTIKSLIILALTFFVSSQTIFANTNYVGTAGTPGGNYFTDIQSAVDATLENGLVLVSNGVYNTGGAVMPYGSLEMTNRITILRNMTIISISGPQSTIIVGSEGINGGQGTGAVRCVYFDVTDAVVSGFTLSNGHTLVHGNETWDKSGGGALMGYGSTITNCIITGCRAGEKDSNVGGGGGAFIYIDGTIDNCIIFNNQAQLGGGALIDDSATDGIIKNSVFFNNYAGYDGGAVRMENGLIINSIFTNNSSKATGGGIGCYDGTIKNCRIENNFAGMESGGSGGGIDVYRNMIIVNCNISGNSAWTGGGINAGSSGINLFSNCVINANVASAYSGGVDLGQGSSLLNSLVFDNLSSNRGGGIYFNYGGTIKNCTVVGNTALISGGGVYCDLYATNLNSIIYFNSSVDGTNYYNEGNISNSVYKYTCTFPKPFGVENISDDPQFVSPIGNNWRLQPTSPCLNAGTNIYAPIPWDLDGNPRIVGGTVDIGAYELVPEPGIVFSILCSVFNILILRRQFNL